MSAVTTATLVSPKPTLVGQTVVVIGGSSGIGLETARCARSEGAEVIITGRDPDRLERAGLDLSAWRTAAFDADDPASLERFFDGLPDPVDHVMVTAATPHDGLLLEVLAIRPARRLARARCWPSRSPATPSAR